MRPRNFQIECFICEGQGIVFSAKTPALGWQALVAIGWRLTPEGVYYCPTCWHQERQRKLRDQRARLPGM